ncbi:hypothetical protein V2J09_014077 [Rumex salicifolius]
MPSEVATADIGEDWPPGFRFHPTDEELILYYLKRKICRRKLKLDVIREVDVYKWDPEELPGLSTLKTGDRQWFFFSPRDRKYPNGSRSNRATRQGYWKATGKDRTITCNSNTNSRSVGIKKTLVFYKGRAPSGERTDWVMHEYILEENELRRCQEAQDYYVLYKVFKKSGAGPKNGEQYGAPFREEDWADDELTQPMCDQNKHVKQSYSKEDVYKEKPQAQFTWTDVEEFMKQLVDEPALEGGPHINDFECATQQVFGEGAQSTLTDTSFGIVGDAGLCKMSSPHSQKNVGITVDMTLSATSQAQLHDGYDVASTHMANLDQHVIEEDFLEMDDLLGPDITHDAGEAKPQHADFELTGGSLQWGEVDGLSEFDLYYDAEMFLRELGPVNETTCAPYPVPQASQMVHQDQLQSREPSYAMNDAGTQQGTFDQTWHFPTSDEPNPDAISFLNTGDGECSGNVTINATGSNSHQNQNDKGIEGDDKWYTSALWSFVDSIPTTPASAAESALVNRAFERMSSFTRLRMNLKNSTAAAAAQEAETNNRSKGRGRMKGFYILSFMGALLAISVCFYRHFW